MAVAPQNSSRPRPHDGKPTRSDATNFYGSQLGGESYINHSYTDMPWTLISSDIYYFFVFFRYLPFILFPLSPMDSEDLCELSFTARNAFCIAVHSVLCVLQLAFILSLPLVFILPVYVAGLGIGLFLLLNHVLCMLLNGDRIEYRSDALYAPETDEHAHERWIFVNGVAVGEHWLRSNLNRLAVTFKRPIHGIHNKTSGIIFDVVECLIQRNLGYATEDVRVCYKHVKTSLYDPKLSKVVLLLHSQGGIIGSMVLDWLLQELPQDLLSKLEVYTFGNAANHFNNPHRSEQAQRLAMRNPLTTMLANGVGDNNDSSNNNNDNNSYRRPQQIQPNRRVAATTPPVSPPLRGSSARPPPALTTEASAPNPSAVSDRAIGHIEHYAHATDFVARWGVLHFATARPARRTVPRFLGRVFARAGARGGHQLVQHYLDAMFPLARDPRTGRLLRDEQTGAPVGCADVDADAFMESEVIVGVAGDGEPEPALREAVELSWLEGSVVNGQAGVGVEVEVEVFYGEAAARRKKDRYKVKELSRLWMYRNGRSPGGEKPPLLVRDANGVVRMATL